MSPFLTVPCLQEKGSESSDEPPSTLPYIDDAFSLSQNEADYVDATQRDSADDERSSDNEYVNRTPSEDEATDSADDDDSIVSANDEARIAEILQATDAARTLDRHITDATFPPGGPTP